MALPPLNFSNLDIPLALKDWLRQLRGAIEDELGVIPWDSISKTGSDIADLETKNHNDLDNIQGGSTGSHYHLTLAEHTDLTDSGDSTIHYHATDRDRSNHTGTQDLSTISDAGTMAGQNSHQVSITGGSISGVIVILPSYTVSGLPDAATYAQGMIYVSDESGGAVPAFSDGSNWRRVTDREIVS